MKKGMGLKILAISIALLIVVSGVVPGIAVSNPANNALSKEIIQSNDTIHAQHQMPLSSQPMNEYDFMKEGNTSISNKELVEGYLIPKKIAFYSDYKSISDTSKTTSGLSYYADALIAKCYTVEQIEGPITSSKLDEYGALLIIGLDEYFSESEINAIEDFVINKSRGLLVSGGAIGPMEDLLSRFTWCLGEIDGRVVCDPTDYEVYKKWIIIKNFADHNITENVNKIVMYKSTVMNTPLAFCAPYWIIAWPDEDSWLDEDGDYEKDWYEEDFVHGGVSGWCNGSIAISGFGGVVAIMDANVFDNSDADGDDIVAFNEYDNDVLGLNIVKWFVGEGEEQDVKINGTVTNIGYPISFPPIYTIDIAEVIEDPFNRFYEGDDVTVSYPWGTPAEIDSGIEIGDYVEVYGAYYEGGYDITLNKSEHYLKKTVHEPKMIYVDDDFIDDPQNHKWNTIQEGINDAEENDTIFVYSGIYHSGKWYGPITITKNGLKLIGEDRDTTIIDGNGECNVITLKSNYSLINNFTIRNSGYWYDGISLDLSSHNEISNNNISFNGYGISTSRSDNNTIRNNLILNNDRYYGMLIWLSQNNTIIENTILENYIGIYTHSMFCHNSFYHNNFINNEFRQAKDSDWEENYWNSKEMREGNYWSDYEEKYPDANKTDGVWDIPYEIPGGAGAKDNYPLVEPWGEIEVGGLDDDGDGVINLYDKCKNTPGPACNDGCPTTTDTDNDGLQEDSQKCPNYDIYPNDHDNDGIPKDLDCDDNDPTNACQNSILISNYPNLFHTNSYLVVGENAASIDMIGSIKLINILAYTGSSIDPMLDSDASGDTTHNIISVGGPITNSVTSDLNNEMGISLSSDATKYTISISGWKSFDIPKSWGDSEDLAVVGVREIDGKNKMAIWGITGQGTWAACEYISEPDIRSNIDADTAIIHWKDMDGDRAVSSTDIIELYDSKVVAASLMNGKTNTVEYSSLLSMQVQESNECNSDSVPTLVVGVNAGGKDNIGACDIAEEWGKSHCGQIHIKLDTQIDNNIPDNMISIGGFMANTITRDIGGNVGMEKRGNDYYVIIHNKEILVPGKDIDDIAVVYSADYNGKHPVFAWGWTAKGTRAACKYLANNIGVDKMDKIYSVHIITIDDDKIEKFGEYDNRGNAPLPIFHYRTTLKDLTNLIDRKYSWPIALCGVSFDKWKSEFINHANALINSLSGSDQKQMGEIKNAIRLSTDILHESDDCFNIVQHLCLTPPNSEAVIKGVENFNNRYYYHVSTIPKPITPISSSVLFFVNDMHYLNSFADDRKAEEIIDFYEEEYADERKYTCARNYAKWVLLPHINELIDTNVNDDEKEYLENLSYYINIFVESKIVEDENGEIIYLESPAHLHAYDQYGRHVGVNLTNNNIIDYEIPEAYYSGPDSHPEIIAIYNDSLDVRLFIDATGNGAFNLTRTKKNNTDRVITEYLNVPITNDTSAIINAYSEHTDDTLYLDLEGDNFYESEIAPDSVTIEDAVPPFLDNISYPSQIEPNECIDINVSIGDESTIEEVSIFIFYPSGYSEEMLMYPVSMSVEGKYNITLFTYYFSNASEIGSYEFYIICEDGYGNSRSFGAYGFESKPPIFDTGSPSNSYPSIFGTHNGTIKTNHTITVHKLYTYPCAGTGGHTEYARIWNNSGLDRFATWSGYKGDWHNITFNETFVLYKNKTYNYIIRTGSYPQIIHKPEHTTLEGSFINCTQFTDANGKKYNNWIPAIKLE